MLSQIIPQECLEKYQNKFKTIEKEKMKINKKIIKNEAKKKLNEEKSELLFITNKKENNIYKKNIELISKISMIKRKINNIEKEIKLIQNGLNIIEEKYNNKKEENDKIKNHWVEFNDDIKNRRIAVKKGEIINKNELNDINKWGNNIIVSTNKKLNDEENRENSNKKKV